MSSISAVLVSPRIEIATAVTPISQLTLARPPSSAPPATAQPQLHTAMSTSYANAFGDQDREAIRKQDVHKQIKDAFSLFDKDAKGVCDVREIGTIVRHLGICPTEIELREMITEIEEEEPTGFIRFEKFERMMSRILLENQYPRDPEDKLLRAFRTLDPDNKGYIEAEKIRTLLTTHGERFSQEEMDDMLSFGSDAESGHFHYGARRAEGDTRSLHP